jgi:uncharacterized membrane protein YfcA
MMEWAGLLLFGVLVGCASAFTGLGGGFLVVPFLIFLGRTHPQAVGTSFVTILVLGCSALLAHARLAHVDWKVGLLLGLGGIVGAQLGARVVDRVDPVAFSRVFAVVLFALAVRMFFWAK